MKPRELACTALLVAAVGGMPLAAVRAAIPPALVAGMRVPSLAPMIRKVSPAVVTISTRGVVQSSHDSAGQESDAQPFAAAGSGVIVDARRGYILTNAHVVDHAMGITVTLKNGRNLQAKLVGSDPPSDIAVVRVDTRGVSLTQIRFGNSARLAVGDFVVAIGNPFGLPDSATAGIVSGLQRSGLSPDDYESYIQTDASINPGNSGGALVNLQGDLVGINTAILSGSGDSTGIGFAIPVNTAEGVMRQLIEYGAVKRGQLGVSLYPVTPEVARSLGLHAATGGLVAQVSPGSPAQKAGVRTGDVITAIAGRRIKSNTDLWNAIGFLRVGDRVTIDLLHDGRRQQRRAVLADTLAGGGPAKAAHGSPAERGH